MDTVKRLTHEEFVEKFKNTRHYDLIELVSQYKNMDTTIVCKCKKHNVEYERKPEYLLRGQNPCTECIREIHESKYLKLLYPEISKLLVHEEDKNSTLRQNKKVDWKCPQCGTVNNTSLTYLIYKGLPCKSCSDGKSFPNKLMYNLLKNLNINFIREQKFIVDNRNIFYDFYIPEYQILIEMDGNFHYTEFKKERFEEQKQTDIIKDKFAIENNYKLIRIDCQKSELVYIRDNILNSELINIFNLSMVNWELINKQSQNSLVIESGKLWNEGFGTKEISEKLGVHQSTINEYLRKCHELNLVEYQHNRYNRIKIRSLNDNKDFESIQKASEFYNIPMMTIISHLKRKNTRKYTRSDAKYYINGKPMNFEYIEK